MADQSSSRKARRRADQALLATYHEARLADLLEHVRAGFAECDAGRIDAFDLDGIIHAISARHGSSGRSARFRALKWKRPPARSSS